MLEGLLEDVLHLKCLIHYIMCSISIHTFLIMLVLPTCADFLMARFAYHCSYKYLQYTSKYFIVGSCIEQTMPSTRKCTT